MSDSAYGFWGTLDRSFQYVGRGTARLLTRRAGAAEDVAYAALGGSLLCAVCGGVVGFALSDLSRSMAVVIGAAIGLLLGACVGVFFGWVFVTAMKDQGITQFDVPVGSLLAIVVIACVAGMFAAVGPGRHAAKLEVLRAVVSD